MLEFELSLLFDVFLISIWFVESAWSSYGFFFFSFGFLILSVRVCTIFPNPPPHLGNLPSVGSQKINPVTLTSPLTSVLDTFYLVCLSGSIFHGHRYLHIVGID